MRKSVTYKESGVDVAAADEIVEGIRKIISENPTSKREYVIGEIGGFAGAFHFGAYWEDHCIAQEEGRRKK